jgi:hypothetical protein
MHARTLAAGLLVLLTGVGSERADAGQSAEGFVSALLGSERHESIPAAEDIYAEVLGSWKLNGSEWDAKGSPRPIEIDLDVVRVLGGRAIQDTWVWTIDPSLPLKGSNRGHGSTFRVYDNVERCWNIFFFDTVDHRTVHLRGRRLDRDIVHEGMYHDKLRRWTFTAITANSFTWLGQSSVDGGKTWKRDAEYFARRKQ